MAKLTVRGIEALKPKGSATTGSPLPRGLYLRVATDGTRRGSFATGSASANCRPGSPGHMEAVPTRATFLSRKRPLKMHAFQALARDGIHFQVQREDAAHAAAEAREVLRTSLTPLRDLSEVWMADGVSRKDGNAELRQLEGVHGLLNECSLNCARCFVGQSSASLGALSSLRAIPPTWWS